MLTSLRPTSAPAQSTSSVKRAMTPQQLFAFASPGVVKIVVTDKLDRPISQRSGFFVNRAGLVATNFHVIAGGSKATILLPDGTSGEVEGVLNASEKVDLALLQTPLRPSVVLRLKDGNPEPIGASAFAIGSPLGLTNTLSAGLISGYRLANDVPVIQTTAAISPGSSGGPLLNNRGEVLGITALTLVDGQEMNFAIQASEVRSLMARGDSTHPLASLAAASKAEESESVVRAGQLLANGKPRDALAMMLRMQSQHPDDVKYWEGLAAIYDGLNEPQNAIDACRKGIALDPGIPALHTIMGRELVKLRKWPEAFAALKQASDLGTKDWSVYADAGMCCAHMNQHAKAETFFKYAIKLGVPNTATYGLLASTQTKLGRPRDAVATLEEALKFDPTDPPVHCYLGDLYTRLGELDNAAAHYTSAARFDPSGQWGRAARAALADLAQRTGSTAHH
jgi:Flp pilus assembly protein TadD